MRQISQHGCPIGARQWFGDLSRAHFASAERRLVLNVIKALTIAAFAIGLAAVRAAIWLCSITCPGSSPHANKSSALRTCTSRAAVRSTRTSGPTARWEPNACVPSQTPADGSAGMADGGSGYAVTINSGPARAAAVSDMRDHAVRLRNWRGRHCRPRDAVTAIAVAVQSGDPQSENAGRSRGRVRRAWTCSAAHAPRPGSPMHARARNIHVPSRSTRYHQFTRTDPTGRRWSKEGQERRRR